jgi:heme O synthase-like polyprenyltransferase
VDLVLAAAVPHLQRIAEDQLMTTIDVAQPKTLTLVVSVSVPTSKGVLSRPAARVEDFFALLKPRVMSLVVFTGLAGMIVAPGSVHLLTAFSALLCIAVAAGASRVPSRWVALRARTRSRSAGR